MQCISIMQPKEVNTYYINKVLHKKHLDNMLLYLKMSQIPISKDLPGLYIYIGSTGALWNQNRHKTKTSHTMWKQLALHLVDRGEAEN